MLGKTINASNLKFDTVCRYLIMFTRVQRRESESADYRLQTDSKMTDFIGESSPTGTYQNVLLTYAFSVRFGVR